MVEEIKTRERLKRDDEAEEYIDFVEKVYGPFRSKAYTECVLQYLNLNRDETWLDAGAGVGRLSLEIAPRVRSLVCVDHSGASLKVLQKGARERGLKNIKTVRSDLCSYSGKVDHFDGILCNEVLQHIPTHEERLRGLGRLNSVLRPGGKCIVNVIRWKRSRGEEKEGYWGKNKEIYRNYFTPEEVSDLMKSSGFRNVYLRGLDILPLRLSSVLSARWTFVDTGVSRMPFSARLGNNLLAIGTK